MSLLFSTAASAAYPDYTHYTCAAPATITVDSNINTIDFPQNCRKGTEDAYTLCDKPTPVLGAPSRDGSGFLELNVTCGKGKLPFNILCKSKKNDVDKGGQRGMVWTVEGSNYKCNETKAKANPR